MRLALLDKFKDIKTTRKPVDAVILSCMDSRLPISQFLGCDAGDAFIMRNAGNFCPHSSLFSPETASTEPAGMELACKVMNVENVIVVGHSDCKAMQALYTLKGEMQPSLSPLKSWVCRCGACSYKRFKELEASGFNEKLSFKTGADSGIHAYIDVDNKFEIADKLSQVNVLQQLENICSYPFMYGLLNS